MARKISILHAAGVGLALFAWSATAQAVHCGPEAGGLGCTDIGGVDASGNCTLSATYTCTADTIINIPGNLTITAGNGIDCSGTDGGPGAPGEAGDPGFNLALNVGGDLSLAGFIVTDGGTGGSGTPGQNGGTGGAAGSIDIDVCGDVDIVAGGGVTATGGSGGPGGSGSSIVPNGGGGNTGGAGGTIDIDADGSLTQASGSAIDAAGGPGGAGGAGGSNNGNGGVGANAGPGGNVVVFSCATDINGLVGAGGGTGGSGGSGGGTTGDGGINGNGANAGNVTLESGSNLFIRSEAHVIASGGNEGAVGGGNPPGSDVASGGNGGTFTTNNCPDFTTDIDGAAVIETQGGSEDGLPGSTVPLTDAPCCPCALEIVKQVAPDEDCDGVADGSFSDSVTQDEGQCVVYQVCVTNTGDTGAGVDDRPQSIENVLVDDADLGIDDEDFGDLDPGDEECRLIPSETPATDCAGGSCICENVRGLNTAVVDSATCVADASDACDNTPPNPGPDSDCDDDATVACVGCSVDIDKTVAPDEDCDGVADGPFVDSVNQDPGECVVYKICVANTGDQTLDATGVQVSDATLGILNLDFGTINSGDPAVCKEIPVDASATACPSGACVCEDVEGTNTAVISAAVCEETQENACDFQESDCEDTADVTCIPCSVTIDKKVALDDDCDGNEDGAFSDSVTQDAGECVVYRICVTNTGDQTLDANGVKVSDANLGVVDLDFGTIDPGDPAECRDIPVPASATQCAGGKCVCEAVEGTNTATISAAVCDDTGENACDQSGSDCDDTATVECEQGEAELCRTPGFWATHACPTSGDDNPVNICEKDSSKNLTQLVINAGGGQLHICGETLTDTHLNHAHSAEEALCVPVKGTQTLQLARQLTAAALNCIISGGGITCSGISVEPIFTACNTACPSSTNAMVGADTIDCIKALDCFNNGGTFNTATGACPKETENCHTLAEGFGACSNGQLCDPNHPCPGGGKCAPGPAGSSNQCNLANGSACTIIPNGEGQCATGSNSPD